MFKIVLSFDNADPIFVVEDEVTRIASWWLDGETQGFTVEQVKNLFIVTRTSNRSDERLLFESVEALCDYFNAEGLSRMYSRHLKSLVNPESIRDLT